MTVTLLRSKISYVNCLMFTANRTASKIIGNQKYYTSKQYEHFQISNGTRNAKRQDGGREE